MARLNFVTWLDLAGRTVLAGPVNDSLSFPKSFTTGPLFLAFGQTQEESYLKAKNLLETQ